ncbi:MAG: hypothetical protein QOJ62_1843 [Actinomycetota bacterium]|nr:hypothetical protein [Actinomycetota bacterium]
MTAGSAVRGSALFDDAGRAPDSERAGRSADPTVRQHWRRNRLVVGAVLVVVLGAIVVALVGQARRHGEFDPRSYDRDGSHAVAALLAQRGVLVDVQTDASVATARATRDSTLVVVHPAYLNSDQLAALASAPSDLVVVGVSAFELAALDFGVQPALTSGATRPQPGCDFGPAVVAGAVDLSGEAYQPPAGGIGCYPTGDGFGLVTFSLNGRQVTLLGDGTLLTNAKLADQGNAALALGLLAAHPDVEWLVPPAVAPESAFGPAKSLTDLIPSRLKWAVLQLVVAVAVLALWRGRRLGRLVPEELPVVVRQVETVLGRGRLYRRSGSRERAANGLREGTRSRLAIRLGFGPGVDRSDLERGALVDAITRRVSRTGPEVHALLYGSTPVDDRGLVALAQSLTTLEQEVLRT